MAKKKKQKFDLEELKKFLREKKKEQSENEVEAEVEGGDIESSSSVSSAKRWYSIRCISGKEGIVKKRIEAEAQHLGMSDAIEDIRIPKVNTYRTHKGKRKIYEKILMPGYVFIKADITPELVHSINALMDVIGFIGGKERMPVPMRDDDVRKILSIGTGSADLEDIDASFVIGEVVKIIDGPFEGFTGKIEEVDSKRQRLRIIINIFGRETPVEINYIQAERIK